MSGRISLIVVVSALAIVLSVAVLWPGQAVLSVAQTVGDPFGDPFGNPFGEAQPGVAEQGGQAGGDFDPFSAKPPEPEPKAEVNVVDPFSVISPSSAEPAPPKTQAPRRAPTTNLRFGEDAIEQALQEKTEMDFLEVPLSDLADYLSDYHEIGVIIDTKALDDVGIEVSIPVTVHLSNVSLRSALNLALRPLSLTWTIHADVLLITTTEQAETMLTIRVHDVADLVTFRDAEGELWEDYDALIDSITSTIAAETWCDVGGPGSISGGTFGTAKVLTVSQTYPIHRQIAELLEQLRTVAAKRPGDGEPPIKQRPAPPADMGGTSGGMGMF